MVRRVEKALATSGGGRLTLMLDAYNLLNSHAVTNFSLRVDDNERVIAALDPIALKAGVRWQVLSGARVERAHRKSGRDPGPSRPTISQRGRSRCRRGRADIVLRWLAARNGLVAWSR